MTRLRVATRGKRYVTRVLVVLLLVASACASQSQQGAQTMPPPSDTRVPPPWGTVPVSAASVPRVFTDVWTRAENRARCALVAPANLSADAARATSRSAAFSGGWAVAYDLPELRSAFGIAGSGTIATGTDVYDQWPHKIAWADGSTAGYGLEGGTGPNWLAYVRIPGQDCLYNVWSRRGKADLELLLSSLRFVKQG